LIVFNRKHPTQRGLKKRFFKTLKLPKLRFGTVGIYCLYSFRFEYRYCLFFRKFFKRASKRRKRKIRTHQRRRTWLFIRPNYTLTHKSKNSRMGKGKGNFKRWCTIVYPGRIFIEHLNAPVSKYKRYLLKMRIKTKLILRLITNHRQAIKQPTITSKLSFTSNKLEYYRARKHLYK